MAEIYSFPDEAAREDRLTRAALVTVLSQSGGLAVSEAETRAPVILADLDDFQRECAKISFAVETTTDREREIARDVAKRVSAAVIEAWMRARLLAEVTRKR